MGNWRIYDERLNVVGKKIENIRTEKKISREDLSSAIMLMGLDISAQALYNLEKGLRTILDYELVFIAKALEVSIESLLADFIGDMQKKDWKM